MKMNAYVKELMKQGEAEIAERNRIRKTEQQAVRDRLSPLESRLAKLLSTIPIEVQQEGLSLNTLQASLKGRWRGSCHPGELGAALRKLGFKRERKWSDGDGFRALWFPT
jgi:hypothetical protein